MAITAIIVAHNSAHVIATALACLNHPAITQCVVVDNASTDDTPAVVVRDFPRTILLRNKKNIGFGRACNQALKQVKTEFVLLLNPDATIDAAGIDRLLTVAATHPDAALIAPALSGNDFDHSTHEFRAPVIDCDSHLPVATAIAQDIHSVRFISGAITLWRMALMRQVGFFDPKFFLFYEDDDVCIRIRRHGYEMLIVSGITATHVPGQSCAPSEALDALKLQSSTWSRLRIERKYRGWRAAYRLARLVVQQANTQLAQAAAMATPDEETAWRASQMTKESTHRRHGARQFMCNPFRFTLRNAN